MDGEQPKEQWTRADTIVGARRRRRWPIVVAIAGVVTLAAGVFVIATGVSDEPTDDPAPAEAPSATPSEDPDKPDVISVYSQLGVMATCWDAETMSYSGTFEQGDNDKPGPSDDIKRLAWDVQILRRLRWDHLVESKIVPRDQVGKLLRKLPGNSVEEKVDDWIDNDVLVALGLLEPGDDLKEIGKQTTEQIEGFYLPKKKILYAGASQDELSDYEKIVLAHELDHALVDQQVGLPSLGNKDLARGDEMLARRALVEGDATLLMAHFAVAAFSPTQAMEVLQGEADPAVAQDLPYVVRRAMEFPYFEGMLFVCNRFAFGGWDEVDYAYDHVPVSTAQILFPVNYSNRVEPMPVTPPRDPAGWEHVRKESFGAAELLWMLQEPQVTDDPYDQGTGIERVQGWRGGRLDVWRKGDDIALAGSFIDDGRLDSTSTSLDMCDELGVWHGEAFPDAPLVSDANDTHVWEREDDYAALRCTRIGPILAIGPTQELVLDLVK